VTSIKLPRAIILAASVVFLVLPPATCKNIKTHFDTGVDLYARRQYHLSLRAFQEVLSIAPKFKEALIMRGRCRIRLDESRHALADFNEVILLDANSADAYLYRAEAYCDLEDTAKAIADCTKSLSLKRSQRGYHMRGKLFLQTGNYSKAIADLDQALKLGPIEANMLLDRAEAFAKEEKFPQSICDCTRALQLPAIENQDIVRAYSDRASAYEKMGKKDLALKDRKTIQAKAKLEWGLP
jgi:tetratricopeptide (TPR) repeat protein